MEDPFQVHRPISVIPLPDLCLIHSLASLRWVGGCPLNSSDHRKGGVVRNMWKAASSLKPFLTTVTQVSQDAARAFKAGRHFSVTTLEAGR